jgi:hypothetical protein
MNKVLMNFSLFLAIMFMFYIIFRSYNVIEGMTTTNTNEMNNSSSNGLAGNAANYTATIKADTIKMQDMLLISKYRKDYESAIIAVDELVDVLMLKSVLNIDKTNPEKSLQNLVNLNQSKSALNNVMKFVDKN